MLIELLFVLNTGDLGVPCDRADFKSKSTTVYVNSNNVLKLKRETTTCGNIGVYCEVQTKDEVLIVFGECSAIKAKFNGELK